MEQVTPPDRLHPLPEAQDRLGGIGRSFMFELLRRGEIRSVKVGRRRMIPQSEIDRFIVARLGDASPGVGG